MDYESQYADVLSVKAAWVFCRESFHSPLITHPAARFFLSLEYIIIQYLIFYIEIWRLLFDDIKRWLYPRDWLTEYSRLSSGDDEIISHKGKTMRTYSCVESGIVQNSRRSYRHDLWSQFAKRLIGFPSFSKTTTHRKRIIKTFWQKNSTRVVVIKKGKKNTTTALAK